MINLNQSQYHVWNNNRPKHPAVDAVDNKANTAYQIDKTDHLNLF